MKTLLVAVTLLLTACSTTPKEKYFYIDESKVDEIVKIYETN